MKHLKLYEQFNQPDYVLKINEILANKSLMIKLQSFYNSLPSKIKKALKDYFDQDRIDVQEILRCIKRYNLISKIKNLYDKGIRNFNDIIDRIFPKNEALFSTLIIISAVILSVAIMGLAFYGIFKLINNYDVGVVTIIIFMLLICSMIGGPVGVIYSGQELIKNREEKEKLKIIPKEERIEGLSRNIKKVIIDSGIKADTAMLYIDENGDYKVKIVTNDSNW